FHDRMISPDIENAVAAQKIEIRLVIHVVEIGALSARVDFVETDHALRRHERAIDVPLVQLIIFAESRSDNLFQIKSHAQRSAIWVCNANGGSAAPPGDAKVRRRSRLFVLTSSGGALDPPSSKRAASQKAA